MKKKWNKAEQELEDNQRMLEHAIKRREELMERNASAEVLDRYRADIESFKSQIGALRAALKG